MKGWTLRVLRDTSQAAMFSPPFPISLSLSVTEGWWVNLEMMSRERVLMGFLFH